MRLIKLVAAVLSIDESELSAESNAENTRNWDSLRHVDLLLATETAFDVKFTVEELNSMQNLGDMRRLLKEKGVNLEL